MTATLGILQTANRPMTLPGCFGNPATFPFPVRYRQVADAWVDRVVPGDSSLEQAFVAAALELEAAGVAAVTTACGFALRYQAAMAAAVRVPVASSSLLLLPTLIQGLRPDARIGVLTYDSRHLSPDLLALAGVADPARVVVAGIEGSESWARMGEREVAVDLRMLVRDVGAAVDRLRAEAPGVTALLFECAGFGPVSPGVRRRTGLPVHDAVDHARLLMAGVGE